MTLNLAETSVVKVDRQSSTGLIYSRWSWVCWSNLGFRPLFPELWEQPL